MSQGLAMLAAPGSDGRPMLLYLVDVQRCCTECGFTQRERFYRETPFHSCTLARVIRLLDELPDQGLQGVCAQCEAELDGRRSVEAWTLHIGPPGGEGLLQGFARSDGHRLWRLSPHEHIDVQLLPVFEPEEDIGSELLHVPTESACRQVLGRCWNLKTGLRELLLHDQSLLGDQAWLSSSVCVGPRALLPAGWVSCVLARDGAPNGPWPDGPELWLADLLPLLGSRELVAAVNPSAVRDALEAIVATFPMRIHLADEDDGSLRLDVEGAPPDAVPLHLHPLEVAAEAARTLSDPADMTRIELERAILLIQLQRDEERP